MALALVSSSCGLRLAGVRDVPLAADRQQQRMDAGRVDGMHRVHAGNDGRNDRPGDLVDDLAERGVFLRRATDGRKGPDGVVAMKHALDVEHRKIVLQAVVAEMIAERSLGQQFLRIDGPADAEVGLSHRAGSSPGMRNHAGYGDPQAPRQRRVRRVPPAEA